MPALVAAGGLDYFQLYTGIGLPERTGPDMLLIAHRGDVERYPENTLEGIVSAAQLRVDGIEFDVHRSADGTWWVIHDGTLDETTTGSGAIDSLPDSVIRKAVIDGGLGFAAERHVGLQVPTLEAVLSALDSYDGLIIVDLQHASRASAADLSALLGTRSAGILCRTPEDASAVKRANPTVRTFLRLGAGTPNSMIDGWLAEAVHQATSSELSNAQLPVITYLDEWRTERDHALALRRAWATGVEAFLTKHPRAAMAAVEALGGTR